MTKMTGREFKEFLRDPEVWGSDDEGSAPDSLIELNGVKIEDWTIPVPDDAKVKVISGYMEDVPEGVPESFAGAARWWLKRRSTATLIVECDKDKLEAVTAAIKAAGGKVCK